MEQRIWIQVFFRPDVNSRTFSSLDRVWVVLQITLLCWESNKKAALDPPRVLWRAVYGQLASTWIPGVSRSVVSWDASSYSPLITVTEHASARRPQLSSIHRKTRVLRFRFPSWVRTHEIYWLAARHHGSDLGEDGSWGGGGVIDIHDASLQRAIVLVLLRYVTIRRYLNFKWCALILCLKCQSWLVQSGDRVSACSGWWQLKFRLTHSLSVSLRC